MRTLSLAFSLALLPSVASASNVLLVDRSGAGDFLDIQPAVDAALDGDTIFLRRPPEDTRRFGDVVIEGKGLTIVNLEQELQKVGPVVVRGLERGQTVVLSGLVTGTLVSGLLPPPFDGLRVEGSAGSVRVDACELYSWYSPSVTRRGRPAAVVVGSSDVVFRDCRLFGGSNTEPLGPGGAGLSVSSSSVALYGTQVTGGPGAYDAAYLGGDSFGGPGGPGVLLIDSTLFASGSEIIGGPGGYAYFGDVGVGGDGGPGIRIGAAASAHALDTPIVGGEHGVGWTQDGNDGPAVIGHLTLDVSDGPRELAAPTRVEEDSTAPLALRGLPGETVVLLESEAPAARRIDPLTGLLHVGAPFRRRELGILPASGELEFAYAPPDAPPGEVRAVVLQAAFIGPGGVRLSAPAHLLSADGEAPPVCGLRLHVDPGAPAGGDGRSWASPLADLREALVQVAQCPAHPTEIWLREGTYRPASPGGDRTAAYRVYSDTHVYGGFAGHETDLSQRDPAAHPTVLDGDLDGDDLPGFAQRDDNAYRLVRAGTSSVPVRDVRLDGLTLRGGNATTTEFSTGAGLLLYGQGVLVGCTFTDNVGYQGAGVYHVGPLEVLGCRFLANRVTAAGGSLFCAVPSGEQATIANTVLAGNVGDHFVLGSALHIQAGSVTIADSVVYANYSSLGASGISAGSSAHVSVTNSILWGNYSDYSAGTQADQIAAPDALLGHCCVQGLDGSLPGVGNIDLDPLFVDPLGADGFPGTLDDDLRLASGSPCIDAGRNADVPADTRDLDGDLDTTEPLPVDLDGQPRFTDDPAVMDTGDGPPPLVDIGAHERQP